MKNKYSVIVFDLGNVLIPFDYTPMLKKFDELKPGLGNKFSELYKNNYHIHRNFESGKLSNDEFLNQMLEWCENTLDEQTFCKHFSEIFTENKAVSSLLPKLKQKDYQLILLSNTNEIHREYGYKNYDFLNHFDKLFLSHQVGFVKPEPEIYKAVQSYTKKNPEEHIFIDDVLEYVEGAKSVGWDAIHFQNYDQLLEDLQTRKII